MTTSRRTFRGPVLLMPGPGGWETLHYCSQWAMCPFE